MLLARLIRQTWRSLKRQLHWSNPAEG